MDNGTGNTLVKILDFSVLNNIKWVYNLIISLFRETVMAIKPISVSQLNDYIGMVLSTDPMISNVVLTGEVSNLNYHGTGHIYFSLKDEESTIKCIIFRDTAEKITSILNEGMKIIVKGYVNVYKRGGYYSFVVREMEPVGRGELAEAFEKIKKKLEGEGLFSQEFKKPLPIFPERVAIVTSETGAAVQDMLKIITGRNNYVDVLIYPCLVQGINAAESISLAIEDINENFKDIDVIIAGRGGGSMEDLWAFNEERVARAIFASEIPVISAVGHETDVTISDFVADRRAETPTAAAVMAVPDLEVIREYLYELRKKSDLHLDGIIEKYKHRLNILKEKLNSLDPTRLIEKNRYQLEVLKERLNSLNPLRILKMGYGALLDENMKLITSVDKISVDDKLEVKLHDGSLKITVDEIRKD